MSYRISTASFHGDTVNRMLSRQADLSKTQEQLASGQRIQSPADDPVAATRILDMERQRSQLNQFGTNAEVLNSRLTLTEQAFADANGVINRIREITLQASGPSVETSARKTLVAELDTRKQELMDIANRTDANGEYLFSGLSTKTRPFAAVGSLNGYFGDQGVRVLQIGTDQKIADGFSGEKVFRSIAQGNGTFAVGQGVHVGTSSIDAGVVVDPSLWVAGNYSLNFTASDTWQVVNSANAVVASGSYSSGSVISFNGAQVKVTGTPAAGDTYTISPANTQDVFSSIDTLRNSLSGAADTAVSRAALTTTLQQSLVQLDNGLANISSLRAELGTRMSTIATTQSVRQAASDELTGAVGKLRDVDYAEAVSRMNQQMLGLQAAQSAYSRIAQLSLFNYL
ncbi:MAG: flagellar hook-associated protein FlgL [Proteobacteria bacterium]|nr:flagellar hook-associated protein FlgL [Pseudomonadota bacterium]